MSEQTWHPYTEPPNDMRQVMLRFDPDGNRDCQGFYSHVIGAYARNEIKLMELRFLSIQHTGEN